MIIKVERNLVICMEPNGEKFYSGSPRDSERVEFREIKSMLDYIFQNGFKNVEFTIQISNENTMKKYRYFYDEYQNESTDYYSEEIICNAFLDKNGNFEGRSFKDWLYEPRELIEIEPK